MKISSHQFLKAFLVGAGLIAVLFAYRSSSKNAASKDLFFADSGDIKIGMPSIEPTRDLQVISTNSGAGFESTPLPAFESQSSDEMVVPEFESSLPDPQWTGADELTADVKNEVMEIVESRERDAFEDLELEVENESQIPAMVDNDLEAETVGFIESAPSVAPEIAPDMAPVSMPVPVPLGEAGAMKAVHHIEYGKSLARRNATEAAGQEFLGALRVLAESNDVTAGGNSHMTALRRGLQAMREAADFKIDDPQLQISLKVDSIIDGHDSKIISRQQAKQMTASNATRRYLEFAGRQLGMCGGQNPVAAEALYCLGKMRTISAQSDPDPESKELYEAIIYQHAALTADPNSHRSANELGVLLARNGQLAAAETYLKNSLQLKQTPQGWANLAKVHHRKGTAEDQRLATLAMNEYQASLHRQTPILTEGPIQLVGAQEFEARSPVQHPNADPVVAGPEHIPVNVPVNEDKPSFVERVGSLLVPKRTNR